MILVFSFLFINVYATNAHHRITLNQARELVWATLSPKALRLPGIEILDADKDPENISSYEGTDPRYLNFSVMSNASNGTCFFVIDSYTGDLFHTNANCSTYSVKKLRALQKKIRRSINMTEKQYHKIKTNGPEDALD